MIEDDCGNGARQKKTPLAPNSFSLSLPLSLDGRLPYPRLKRACLSAFAIPLDIIRVWWTSTASQLGTFAYAKHFFVKKKPSSCLPLETLFKLRKQPLLPKTQLQKKIRLSTFSPPLPFCHSPPLRKTLQRIKETELQKRTSADVQMKRVYAMKRKKNHRGGKKEKRNPEKKRAAPPLF